MRITDKGNAFHKVRCCWTLWDYILITTLISLSVVTKAEILENECKLEDPSGSILANPADLNEGPPQPIRWTNNVIWTRAVTKWDARFSLPATPPDLTGLQHYVKDYRFGIKFASTKLRQVRGLTDIWFSLKEKMILISIHMIISCISTSWI